MNIIKSPVDHVQPQIVLNDVCTLITDGTHYTPKDIENGYAFLTVKDMTPNGLNFTSCSRISGLDYNAATIAHCSPARGDVLFSKDGTVGKVHVVDEKEKFAVLSSIAILRCGENINPAFLGFALKSDSVLTAALDKKSGSAIRRIVLADLKKLKIPLFSISEQTAIANILSDQESLIAHYDNLIALHEKRFAYLSDELLSGRLRLDLKSGGEIVCSNNEEWKEVDLNGDNVIIPKTWSIATLPEVCTLTNGSSFKPSEKEEYGIPIVRIQNLTDPDSEYYHYSGSKKGLVPLVSGDLLFSWSGTIGVYTYTLERGYLNQHIFKVTPIKIDATYAKYFLMQSIDKFQRSGLTMPHITLAEIRKRKLVVCEEEQQKLIGHVLSDQETLIAEYKKLRDAEKKRFDWLSDALLSGTYRVRIEP